MRHDAQQLLGPAADEKIDALTESGWCDAPMLRPPAAGVFSTPLHVALLRQMHGGNTRATV